MSNSHYDLCVIGGGINGTGIARDAAGRGLSVLLVEADDLGGATSGASTKLIHGGLRYLEHYEFLMVRDALKERERLMNIAPHLISPMEFILPHDKSQRPIWMIRLGLFLYDNLVGTGPLPGSKKVDLSTEGSAYGTPLISALETGFSYHDGWVDDCRLVVLNALDAAEKGAEIRTRTICRKLTAGKQKWVVGLSDAQSGEEKTVTASMVVNATGPWVRGLLNALGVTEGDPDLPGVRLVKGSHVILPRQYNGAHSYILQQPDKRIVFAIPYEENYTLIGTTEEDYEGSPSDAHISDQEMTYLCEAWNRSFEKQITRDDIVFTYSGVRPLINDGNESASAVTRDYKIYNHKRFSPPLLSVFGGKLTTYRVLSEKVVNTLFRLSGRTGGRWTAVSPLPGGDLGGLSLEKFIEKKREAYPWLPEKLLLRYARSYGSYMSLILQGAEGVEHLGQHYGDGVFEAEINYLVKNEWAQTSEDVLWRRSKLGLHVTDKTAQNIEKAVLDLRK